LVLFSEIDELGRQNATPAYFLPDNSEKSATSKGKADIPA